MRTFTLAFVLAASMTAAERPVDPTFLHRYVPEVQPKPSDVTSDSCVYRPVFGAGDSIPGIVRGVARFGEVTVAPGGRCTPVSYPAEEQVYVIQEGSGTLHYGEETAAVKKNDFMYLPAGVRHGMSNGTGAPCKLWVMGFRIPPGTPAPPKLLMANIDQIKKQTVGGHPDSVLYQLMMGDTKSTRDRIAAGKVLTSLYIMEFAPGGTNAPHHHDAEEEIYVLLDGKGEMVAGGGQDGTEGRHPARAGDAWFFRLNCTVGFYNSSEAGLKAHILAVRSMYPRRSK